MRAYLALAPILVLCIFVAGCGGSGSSGGGNGGVSNAALVNGNAVPMRTYQIAFEDLRLTQQDNLGYDPCAAGLRAQICLLIEEQALQSVIGKELITEYAAAHHITVSKADIDRQWQLVYHQKFNGRRDVVNAWLKHIYNPKHGIQQTEQDLKNGVAQDLLQQRVIFAVTGKGVSIAPGIRLAVIEAALASLKFVQSHLKAGEDFVGLAGGLKSVKSSRCSALKCGELGWVPNALVPADKKQVLTAPVGSVVGPYKGQLVFELYKVQARAAHIVLTAGQSYQIRLTQFSAWLARQESHAKVTRYVAV